jgi:phosphoribosyl 1,2-cyclic phosphodiesterase
MRVRIYVLASLLGLATQALVADLPARAAKSDVPLFLVDPFWPKPLPNRCMTGTVGGVCVNKQDHIFGVNRVDLTTMEQTVGKQPAPVVIEYDAEGNIVLSQTECAMRVQVLGSGDAFGSGGRLNTCFMVHRGTSSLLIDCGASVMIAIRRFGIDPNQIGAIFLTHLHADHFGGLPFFILDAQLVSRRTSPLAIIGPRGTRARLHALMETCFPGSANAERKFSVEVTEIEPDTPIPVPGVNATVTGYRVTHPSGSPSLGLRVGCDGRVIAYTGDTEWVENIISIGRDSDLFFAEAYWFERR